MFLIHAKNDCFLEAVLALLEKIGDFLSNELGAVVNDDVAVEVFGVVDAVFDFVTVPVRVAPLRAVALYIQINMNFDYLVRGQEAVLDSLLERVGIDRLSEIMNVGNVLGFFGRGGKSDLGGGGEVFKNLAPGRIVGRAAAVALVYDDQVKKAG